MVVAAQKLEAKILRQAIVDSLVPFQTSKGSYCQRNTLSWRSGDEVGDNHR